MKKLLLLGSNEGYREVSEYMKKRGDYLIVTDYLPYEQSPGKQLADEYWDIDTHDLDRLYEKAREAQVDGVLATTGERNIEYAMRLSKRLGTPFFMSEETWSYSNNKRKLKDLCREYGIPVPEDFSPEEPPKAEDYPVIVKPVDNCFSRGISVCRDESELDAAIEFARQNSPSEQVVIEKYIQGTHFDLIYNNIRGVSDISGVAEILTQSGEPRMSYNLAINCSDSRFRYYKAEYDEKVRRMLEEMGGEYGTHTVQFISDEKTGVLYLYEINSRLDGLGLYNTLKRINGADMVKMMVDVSLDGSSDVRMKSFSYEEFPSICYYIIRSHKKCRIAKIEGLEKFRDKLSDLYILQACREGMEFPESYVGNAFFVFVFTAPTRDDVLDSVEYINDNLKVYDTEGEDVLVRFTDIPKLR